MAKAEEKDVQVKVFNRGKRTITCHDGHLAPNQNKPYSISKTEADKLVRLYPDEIIGTEEAMRPFQADGEKPSPASNAKTPQASKGAKPPAPTPDPAAAAAREKRLGELLQKSNLNEDEKKELDSLEKAGAGK